MWRMEWLAGVAGGWKSRLKKNGRGRLVDVVPRTMGVIDVQLEKTRSQAVKSLEEKTP